MLEACAVVAPCSPQTHAQAAASLAEAAARGEGQEGEGKKEKRTRKKKDPAAPKKALTAYLVFINSKREQIIREHPSADLKDQVSPSHVLLLPTHAPLHMCTHVLPVKMAARYRQASVASGKALACLL